MSPDFDWATLKLSFYFLDSCRGVPQCNVTTVLLHNQNSFLWQTLSSVQFNSKLLFWSKREIKRFCNSLHTFLQKAAVDAEWMCCSSQYYSVCLQTSDLRHYTNLMKRADHNFPGFSFNLGVSVGSNIKDVERR